MCAVSGELAFCRSTFLVPVLNVLALQNNRPAVVAFELNLYCVLNSAVIRCIPVLVTLLDLRLNRFADVLGQELRKEVGRLEAAA